MSKLWLKMLGLVILISLLAGCSTEQGGKGKIILRWSGYSYPVYNKFRSEQSKFFEKSHPHVIVKYQPVTGQYNSKLLTQLASNTAPDVFFAADLSTYISKNALVDLTKWYQEDTAYFQDINPALIKAQMWNGRLYALPGNSNVDILYYNKKLFDEKGLKYPDATWTWQDFLAAAKKLTIRNDKGRVIQYGAITSTNWPSLILENGGKIWNKDKTKCIIDSPEARVALEFWKDFYAKYKVSPTPLERRDQGTREMFIAGRAAMYWGSSWEVATFKIIDKIQGRKGGLDWDATLIPRPKGKKRFIGLVYTSLGVWSGSKHPKLAYELAKFMTQPARIKFLVEVGDSLPIRSRGEAMDYYLKDPNRPEKARESMLKALSLAKSYYRTIVNPNIPYLEQSQIITETLQKFTIGNTPAGKVLQLIENKLNNLLQEKR